MACVGLVELSTISAGQWQRQRQGFYSPRWQATLFPGHPSTSAVATAELQVPHPPARPRPGPVQTAWRCTQRCSIPAAPGITNRRSAAGSTSEDAPHVCSAGRERERVLPVVRSVFSGESRDEDPTRTSGSKPCSKSSTERRGTALLVLAIAHRSTVWAGATLLWWTNGRSPTTR